MYLPILYAHTNTHLLVRDAQCEGDPDVAVHFFGLFAFIERHFYDRNHGPIIIIIETDYELHVGGKWNRTVREIVEKVLRGDGFEFPLPGKKKRKCSYTRVLKFYLYYMGIRNSTPWGQEHFWLIFPPRYAVFKRATVPRVGCLSDLTLIYNHHCIVIHRRMKFVEFMNP